MKSIQFHLFLLLAIYTTRSYSLQSTEQFVSKKPHVVRSLGQRKRRAEYLKTQLKALLDILNFNDNYYRPRESAEKILQ